MLIDSAKAETGVLISPERKKNYLVESEVKNMKQVTSEAWYEFDNPRGCYTLENGVLWKQEMDTDGHFSGEPYRIDDTRGYEHIIKDIEWFCRDN